MAELARIERIRAHVEAHKDRERAMFTIAGVAALLDELSRLKGVERELDKLRDELRIAIAIGPRCGSESLYHVIKWREQGLKLREIATMVGVTKATVHNAITEAKERALARTREKEPEE